jgi:hypothetical protein
MQAVTSIWLKSLGRRLILQRPVKRNPPDIQERGHVLHPFAFVDLLPCVFDLRGGKFRLAAKLHAAPLGFLDSGAGALGYHGSLKFGQNADKLPHGAACRCLGVYGLGDALQPHSSRSEVV